MTDTWIGIDLGTSNCAAAVWDSTRGHPKWMRLSNLATPQGNKAGRIVPSAVLFLSTQAADTSNLSYENVSSVLGQTDIVAYVGITALQALDQAYDLSQDSQWSPEQISNALVTSVKRILGLQRLDDVDMKLLESLPCQLEENEQGVVIRVQPLGSNITLCVTPTEVAAILLQSIRKAADKYLRRNVKKKNLVIPGTSGQCLNCVVGVPVHFSQRQRKLIEQAARRAGFSGQVLTLTESTAAAMAYGLSVASQLQKTILVFDMGGGTTDVTIAELNGEEMHVKVTQGDPRLGGDDMDAALLQFVLQKLHLTDLTQQDRRLLLQQCRRGKEKLCGDVDHGMYQPANSVTIIFQGTKVEILQSDFVRVIQPCLEQARPLVQAALDQYANRTSASRSEVKVDEVILIGGATRVPAVRDLLRELFPPPPDLCLSVNAMAAVAQGCAIRAAIVSKTIPMHELRSALMLDTVPHAIGALIGDRHFVEILSKDATLPAKGFATFQLADVKQPGVTVTAVERVGKHEGVDLAHSKLGDFTFLLHRLTSQQLSDLKGVRSIDIGMTLTENGEFIVSIFDPNDPEHIRKKERFQKNAEQVASGGSLGYTPAKEGFPTEQIALVVACLLLFALYVAVKLLFHEDLRIDHMS